MGTTKSHAKSFTPVSKITRAAKSKPSNSGLFKTPQKMDSQPNSGRMKSLLDYAVNHHRRTSAKPGSE